MRLDFLLFFSLASKDVFSLDPIIHISCCLQYSYRSKSIGNFSFSLSSLKCVLFVSCATKHHAVNALPLWEKFLTKSFTPVVKRVFFLFCAVRKMAPPYTSPPLSSPLLFQTTALKWVTSQHIISGVQRNRRSRSSCISYFASFSSLID